MADQNSVRVKRGIFLFVILCSINAACQVRIKGNTIIDSTWRNYIYASYIPALTDLYRCSNSMIISNSEIDSLGSWELEIPEIPATGLIRIHVSKVTQPVASLIIGGKESNHAFIAIGHNKELEYNHEGDGLFSDFACNQDSLNLQLKRIKAIYDLNDSNYRLARGKEEKLRILHTRVKHMNEVADTVPQILAALYATHLSDIGSNKIEVYQTIEKIEEKFGVHPYTDVVSRDSNRNSILIYIMVVVGLFLLSYTGYRLVDRYLEQMKKRRFNLLSGREYDVFNLVIESKSNREIADSLNVEISTVKSHLQSIYRKLKVSNRNQLRKYLKY